jgi:hypothetical protein
MTEKLTKGEENLKGLTSKWKRGKYRKEAEKEYNDTISHLGPRVPKDVRKRIANPAYKEKQIRAGQRSLKEWAGYKGKGTGRGRKITRKRVAGK